MVQRDTRGPSSRCSSGSGVRRRRIQFSSQIDEGNIARRGTYAAGESGTHRGISIGWSQFSGTCIRPSVRSSLVSTHPHRICCASCSSTTTHPALYFFASTADRTHDLIHILFHSMLSHKPTGGSLNLVTHSSASASKLCSRGNSKQVIGQSFPTWYIANKYKHQQAVRRTESGVLLLKPC